MSASLTFADAAERFIRRFDSVYTIRSYNKVLNDLAHHLGPDVLLVDITPEQIDDWDVALRSRQLSPATVASRHKHVRAFFNWCVHRRYLRANPARYLDTKAPRRQLISKAIPEEVLIGMIQAAASKRNTFTAIRDTAILSLLVTYGARSGDVSWLTLDHVDLDANWLVFHVKGGKEIRLPVVDDVRETLGAWLRLRYQLDPDPSHNFVFVNNRLTEGSRYQPLTAAGIQSMVARLSKEVSGKVYRPHSIRHWRGQSLADAGVPITVTQAILGHNDSGVTAEHYYNQDAERVSKALERRPRVRRVGNSNIIQFPRTG